MSHDLQASSEPDPILAAFRRSIDNIDAALIHMLAERFRVTQAVGELKAELKLPPADPGREGQRGMAGMAERIEQLGGTLNVISEPGKGTQIEALFPWAPRALERASTNKVMR